MPPRFAYGFPCSHGDVSPCFFAARLPPTQRGGYSVYYFFTNRPRLSERSGAGRNSPSRRMSFPSK